jgi:hypothetical protein
MQGVHITRRARPSSMCPFTIRRMGNGTPDARTDRGPCANGQVERLVFRVRLYCSAIPKDFKSLPRQSQYISDFRWSTSPLTRKMEVGKDG